MNQFLLNFIGLILQSGRRTPPPPRLSDQSGDGPEGVQLPIDGDLWILIILGLSLGIYFIYRWHRFTVANKG